jgi:hypothetical protein
LLEIHIDFSKVRSIVFFSSCKIFHTFCSCSVDIPYILFLLSFVHVSCYCRVHLARKLTAQITG